MGARDQPPVHSAVTRRRAERRTIYLVLLHWSRVRFRYWSDSKDVRGLSDRVPAQHRSGFPLTRQQFLPRLSYRSWATVQPGVQGPPCKSQRQNKHRQRGSPSATARSAQLSGKGVTSSQTISVSSWRSQHKMLEESFEHQLYLSLGSD